MKYIKNKFGFITLLTKCESSWMSGLKYICRQSYIYIYIQGSKESKKENVIYGMWSTTIKRKMNTTRDNKKKDTNHKYGNNCKSG